MVQFEKQVIKELRLPSIPKKEWDGKSSFDRGVAVVGTLTGGEAYAIATFNKEKDEKPRIIKVFSYEPFQKIKKILVVPEYMDKGNPDELDLDDASKKAAELLQQRAQDAEKGGDGEGDGEETVLPENEYCFDNIHDDDEAHAFLEAYYKQNGIKGTVPTKHDTMVAKLTAIWQEQQMKGQSDGSAEQ